MQTEGEPTLDWEIPEKLTRCHLSKGQAHPNHLEQPCSQAPEAVGSIQVH